MNDPGERTVALRKIEMIKRRARIRHDYMVLHVRDKRSLAARHGVTVSTVEKDLKEMFNEIRIESKEEAQHSREVMVASLWRTAGLCMDDYYKSREGWMEQTTTKKLRLCRKCKGSKGNGEVCTECDGKGEVLVPEEMLKVRPTPGDVTYIHEARGIMADIAKLEGLYPGKDDDGDGKGGDTYNQYNIDLSKASDDDLLAAMEVFERLGLTRQKVLEVTYNRVEEA